MVSRETVSRETIGGQKTFAVEINQKSIPTGRLWFRNAQRAGRLSFRSGARLLTESFVQRMAIFGALLAVWGAKTNLTAHPDDAVETAFHIIDSMMPLALAKNPNWGELASAFAPGTRILDFGSGAGFPGLILASACDAYFVLAEARQKRASFLKIAAAELDLRNVEVRAGRWSHAADGAFNAVLSRASGPPTAFFELAAHALTHDGVALLYSTTSQRLELTAAREAGLGSYRRWEHTVRRGSIAAERVLAIWRRSEKAA